MSKKPDTPDTLDDGDLDQAAGGYLKLGDIDGMKGFDGKTVDDFTKVTGPDAGGIAGPLKGDKSSVLIQNIGFPDEQKAKKF